MLLSGYILVLGKGITSGAIERQVIKHGGRCDVLEDINTVDFDFNKYDVIITSPGIPYDHPIYKRINSNYMSDIDLFCALNKTPIIAVTGTNGKTTVTHMIKVGLESKGYKVKMGGNQETSALDLLDDQNADVVVLELSSFQLCHSTSCHFAIGVITNIAPDHVKWHQSFNHYKTSKMKLEHFTDQFIFMDDSSHPIHEKNQMTAIKVCRGFGVEVDSETIENVRLPHRQETFTKYGIQWVNDSKATNVAATKALLSHYQCKPMTYVILGGQLKGDDDFGTLNEFSSPHLQFVAYGEAQDTIAKQMDITIHHYKFETVLHEVMQNLKQDDTVILSPGCSSFDQFKSYMDRGDFFKSYVNQNKPVL
ncbi:MAG: hypothetical protein CMF41_00690 [Legionellales bacterium]|nr:hypothetical protein [Legionellales bacterium]